jgi:hypothetical protein
MSQKRSRKRFYGIYYRLHAVKSLSFQRPGDYPKVARPSDIPVEGKIEVIAIIS